MEHEHHKPDVAACFMSWDGTDYGGGKEVEVWLLVVVPSSLTIWTYAASANTPYQERHCRYNAATKSVFFLNNQPDALIIQIYSVIKLSMFGHLLCPSSGVFPCTFSTGKFHAGFWCFHPDSAWKRSSKTRMKLSSAECTVENSWWWAKKMPKHVVL